MPFEPRLFHSNQPESNSPPQPGADIDDQHVDDQHIDLELPDEFQELAAQLSSDSGHLADCYPGVLPEDRWYQRPPANSGFWKRAAWRSASWVATAAALLILGIGTWSLGWWNVGIHSPNTPSAARYADPTNPSTPARDAMAKQDQPAGDSAPAVIQPAIPAVTPAVIREPLSGEDLEGLSDLGDVSMSI